MRGFWVVGFLNNMGETLVYTVLIIVAWEYIFKNLIKKILNIK